MKKLLRCILCFLVSLSVLPFSSFALNVDDARELLETYYIDDLPAGAADAQTLDELLSLLNDPYTVYMGPEEYEAFLNSFQDTQVVGIGVSIQNHERGLLIVSVLDNSPALEAGLVPGDIIIAVGDTPVRTTEEATALIVGEEGTPVQISVLRQDGSVLELTLVRRAVLISSTAEYSLSEDGNAGVILCTRFGDETANHFKSAIVEHDETVNAWIIDLSANPGGTDRASAAAAGWFVGGAPMVYYRDGSGSYYYVYTSPFTPVLTEKPAIILTSNYSASGAELFSAAMRDYGKAIAVGERTFGKGVAQVLMTESDYPDLFDADALKMTVYRFFSPVGTTNDRIGVLPTLLVSLENSYAASLLLCADAPESAKQHLKLQLSGLEFFIDLNVALDAQFRPAFAEILESLIPSTQLWKDDGSGQWTLTTPADIARELGLSEYTPRQFSDIENTPYADAIRTLSAYDLISGFGDGSFRPDKELTRAELCAMLANLLNLDTPTVEKSKYYDVVADFWYTPAIHAVCEFGLIPAYTDNSFHPDLRVTQQELVSILTDVATYLNMHAYDMKQSEPTDEELAVFSNFSVWARKAAWILDGQGLDLSALEPRSSATRGIAADLISQLMRQSNLLWQ